MQSPISRHDAITIVIAVAIITVAGVVANLVASPAAAAPRGNTYTTEPTPGPIGTSTLYASGPDGKVISCGTNNAGCSPNRAAEAHDKSPTAAPADQPNRAHHQRGKPRRSLDVRKIPSRESQDRPTSAH